jgi:hypothetical protein
MADQPRQPSKWRPWGFEDYESVPEMSEEGVSAALNAIGVKDDAQSNELRTQLQGVSIIYWRTRRDVETPSPKWYRQQIEPIQKATVSLLNFLKMPVEGTARSALRRLTMLRMNRQLRGSNHDGLESIEQLLENFKSVCDECLRLKGSAGAREQSHVREAVRELVAIWRRFTGKRLSLSLDTEIGETKHQQFFYPGPRFVQVIMQAIDFDLTTAEIGTALRKALGNKRVRKSERESR